MDQNVNIMKFIEFCIICDKIASARREKKAQILQKFISEYKRKNESSFYPILRFLVPQLDRERAAYGIKETILARIYVRILCLHPESADALKLKNFRTPKNAGSNAGDFAEVAFWVLKSRCAEGHELTIDDVHRHLDTIALRHAEKKPREVDSELEAMMRGMSAQEQKWLIRIVLKDMRLGLGSGRILSAFHPDAQELYNFSNSLQQICDKLRDLTLRLHEIEVTLFTPCRPMLAERCDVQQIDKHFTRRPGPRYVETKLDGERSQLHYESGQFKFFSRNAFEFTDAFGNNSSSGSLTPYLAKQLKPGLKNCILDGEMMPWNTKHKCFGSKGMNLDVKTLRIGNVHQPCFCVFDVLYYNDKVLTNQPLRQRLTTLDLIFSPCEGIMMHPSRHEVTSGEEVLNFLNNAIDNLEEGIVVKEPESVYKPNSRKDGWIKIKPEYTAGAMAELDLLIVGGYYGEGRRRGVISHFLLGLAQTSSSLGGDPEVFESITRVGSGCTMDELAELGRKLEPHWRPWRGTPPSHLLVTREKPQLWIEPQHSVILQVKASEVVRSDLYQTGYTLRFPRIEKVRYDKPWRDCLTVPEFTQLRQSASGSLVGSHISSLHSPRAKKQRSVRPEPMIASHFRNSNLDRVKSLSRLLAGMEICVLTGLQEVTKQQLECKVAENGGNVVLNPGKDTFCVVVGEEKHVRVTNVVRTRMYDVVRAHWLLSCLNTGQLLPFTPADMVCATAATAEWMAEHYDQYGDSYVESATLNSLQQTLSQMETKHLTEKQVISMDKMLFGGSSPFSIFRGCTAYFDFCKQVGTDFLEADTPLKAVEYAFQFQRGEIAKSITSSTTHVVLYSSELDRLEELIDQAERRGGRAHVVQHYWILKSLDASVRLPEDKYCLHKWTDS